MRVIVVILVLSLLASQPAEARDSEPRPLPDRASFPDNDNYDKALRNAWQNDDLRDRAAAELHRLHDESAFKLPIDDERVATLRRSLGAGFDVLKTPDFVIISDAGSAEVRKRAQTLARTRHQFYRFAERIGYPAVPHRERLVCILFEDYSRYRAFAASRDGVEAPWAGGYYSRANNHIVLFNERTSPSFSTAYERIEQAERQLEEIEQDAEIARRSGDRSRAKQLDDAGERLADQIDATRRSIREQLTDVATATLVHEAAHMLSFNSGVQDRSVAYPFWLTEGLASSFETNDPGLAFGPDRPYEPREAKYRSLQKSGQAPELGVLVSIADDQRLTADQASVLYPASYAMFTMVARTEPEALNRLLQSYAAEGSPADHAERFGRYLDPGACGRRLAAR